MKQTNLSEFGIPARPVKSFFVDMLTRDIELEDAILDLLDNCVDGILRSGLANEDKPYNRYHADIEIRSEYFSITDNCGGIPRNLLNYAFMMGSIGGKLKNKEGTVGVYGIGMKRAIFKLGREAQITTRNGKKEFMIDISEEWIDEEEFKDLNVKQHETSKEDGTTIIVTKLNDDIKKQFSEGLEDFKSRLSSKISTNFAYIIEKGFKIKIGDDIVKPKTTIIKFFYQEKDGISIRPYIFETSINGVDVFLTVGLTRSFLSQSEIEREEKSPDKPLLDAGWTVICNDRVVLERNRDKTTGWGEYNVPNYHNQFRIIAGIVEFKSEYPDRLPTTTTKRGINPDHPIYREIKKKMCEGTKIFTDFTNKWKKSGDEIDHQINETTNLSINEIKNIAHTSGILKSITVESVKGKEYKPVLPQPGVQTTITAQKISFSREADQISAVAEYLKLKKWKPATVGEKCFDRIYKESLP